MYFSRLKTFLDVGLVNIGRVILYRFMVRSGFNPLKRLKGEIPEGDFFLPYGGDKKNLTPNPEWQSSYNFFGESVPAKNEPPEWSCNYLSGHALNEPMLPWYELPDFDKDLGDIKGVWEASRFSWVLCFAQRAALGEEGPPVKLNKWLDSWVHHNPTYLGLNWKCGQEASIRLMHLAIAAMIMGQHKKSCVSLLALLKAHLQRISPTISYAVAQDNNHGTSEAAALYIGGSWLLANGDSNGLYWQKKGLYWLENRAKRLIADDGSFSQYSVNYHRVLLDTYSMAEVWRKELGLAKFSEGCYKKLAAATEWLYGIVQEESGGAPNLGANDGARLLPLTGTEYRDFRPCVQLAACLFLNKAAYVTSGEWDFPLQWLGLQKPQTAMGRVSSKDFTEGGYTILRCNGAFAFLRYPKFKFRPSQCDALHLDFWLKGQNILRDGGTYSYNAGQDVIAYYGGAASHNLVQFDTHEQMPRISRFLLGGWLKTCWKKELSTDESGQYIGVAYRDRYGCRHRREVFLTATSLRVVDTVEGFKKRAVLRWRLIPSEWTLTSNGVACESFDITVTATEQIKRKELVVGFESLYYYKQTELPVLEVEVTQACKITTELFF